MARRWGRHVTLAAGYTADEMMTVAAARHLADGEVCFVGIGIPSLAANLARHTHAPGLVLVYESGTIGSKPRTIPLSIGDGELAETADAVVSVPEIFNYWLQPGRIDVGFLGAAELDRRGDINTTVIGPYDAPRVRLPGAGGAPEIARSCGRVVVILRHSPRALVERVGFRTSLGDRVATVVTDIGVLERDPDRDELVLAGLHPGRTVDEARAATGWDLAVDRDVAATEPPTGEELDALRELAPAADRVA
ncbi:MAG TPA: CoA-transferase [Acidimicrobiales bacterium]|nr:CoA-transferase [Acidimicrobiales bacterium]